ncbi:cadherin-like beta sandwich domain-containing protein [Paenibacillus sp. GCM10023248]|uniref:cadherin-like beta sandwich domain-containing protein n=1 Tax=unclassified Paenibacillus TaxID=185978 RepID=UPI0023785B32|nr:cadherin-like beta sandwich domain-containing protein [Paenibacillus sp. MAHUQ-63]MDD9266367.1 cadherin-like beta sandwich domain-containing protein [Paenibacillus sp. MAHUQ-63]
MNHFFLRQRLAVLLMVSMVLSLLVLPAPGRAADVEVDVAALPTSADAAIVMDNAKPEVANTNYDSRTNLSSSTQGLFSLSTSSSKKTEVYFKFDVSSVTDATYKFYLQVSAKKGSSDIDTALQVYGLSNNDWQESTLTWNNAPVTDLSSMSPIGQFTVTQPNASKPVYYNVDVTDYVRQHLPSQSLSFLLASESSNPVNIYAKENTSASNPEPQLLVRRIVQSDTTPPSWAPGSALKSLNLGTDFVQLAWPAATDDSAVTNYKLYQNDELLTTVTGSTYYTVQGLAPHTNVIYSVYAGDAVGNYSLTPLTYNVMTLSAPVAPLQIVEVNASSSDGNVESNTLDNNLFSRWSASGDGQYIMFDLGQPKTIGYVGIAFYKGDLRTTLIDIQTSNDAQSWTNVFTGNSRPGTVDMQAFDIPDTNARFVRIVGHGNSDGSTFTSLTEVMIYMPFPSGDTPVATVPNVTPTAPPGTAPFTQPGLTKPDGSPHPVHTPHPVTGATLNVLDYGANPADNGQDDRAAIQNAIDAAASGDEVYIPNGVYNLMSSPDGFINLKLKSGVNLRGESEAGTILKSSIDDVKNSSVLKSSNQHDLLVSNLTVTSTWNRTFSLDHVTNNPAAGGPDSMIAIANYGENPSYNVTIDHVTVERFRRMAIRIENSHDVVVRHATFRNATDLGGGGAGYGTSIQGMPKVDRLGFDNDTYWNVVEDSTFEGPYLRHGSLIQNVAHNNVLRNNHYNQTKLDAIDLHGELEYLNDVYGNTIENIYTGGGVGLGNTGGTAPSNHSKTGPNNYIHDNVIRNSREGIVVTMGTPDTRIERNIIEQTTTVNNGVGINILNGPGTRIVNNIIRNNTAPGYWGILLEHDNGDQNAGNIGAGDPANVLISGNTITGNTGGIYLQKGTDITVAKNILSSNGTDYLKADGVTATETWPSADNALSELTVSAGTLSPLFDRTESSYSVTLPAGVREIQIIPTASSAEATVTVNGTAVDSGTASSAIRLNVGANVIGIVVTAENQTAKTYQLTVTRLKSDNTNLSGLTTNAGTLSPVFSADNTEYELSVSNAIKEISLTPTAADSEATVTVNGTAVDSGTASSAIRLNVGANVIGVVVTAENQTTKTYQLTVTRLAEEFDNDDDDDNDAPVNQGPSGAVAPSPAAQLKTEVMEKDGKTVVTSKVDEVTLDAILRTQGEGPLTLAVGGPSGTEQVRVELTSSVMRKLADVPSVTLTTPLGGVKLPVKQLSLDQLAAQLGTKPENVRIEVVITHQDGAAAQAKADGLQVVASIDFAVHAVASGNQTVEIAGFKRYVPYTVKPAIAAIAERNLAALRVVQDANGTTSYEPVPFTVINGEITFYSRTNSTVMFIANEISFSDTRHHWAQDSIERMANKWFVQGFSQDEFRPDQPVTRAELAAMITRAFGLKSASNNGAFRDTEETAWYSEAIHAAVEAGIATGYEDGTFRPDQTITREEMAVMIDRALQAAGYNEQQEQGQAQAQAQAQAQDYEDRTLIHSWAQEAVKRLGQLQLMDGTTPSTFDPKKEATRAQSAVLLQRLLQVLTFK